MKLLHFDDFRLGVLNGVYVVDVSDIANEVPHIGPHDRINGLIENFDNFRDRLETAAASGNGTSIANVRIRPPMPKPGNIDSMAVNYMEDGTRDAPAPINAFHKSPNAVIGNGDTMVLPDVPASVFEGEAEVALIIGKRASNVSESDAMDYVFGFTNFIDGSARGLPPTGNTFYQAKSRETFAPMGPYIVTKDEVINHQNLHVQLRNNGNIMQDFNTDDMAHKIPRCVSWVSATHTLEPGDVLATGTNHRGLHPFMDGDKVELEIESLGCLTINIKDDQNRTWERITRLQHAESGRDGVHTPQTGGKYA